MTTTALIYTVASSRLVGHKRGSKLQGDELDGLDVASLVAGGHLVPDEPAASTANPATSKKEK